jgi:hypothetical protein
MKTKPKKPAAKKLTKKASAPKKSTKIVLRARPVMPAQWPRNAAGEFEWVTVTNDGPSTTGGTRSMPKVGTVSRKNVKSLKEDFADACGVMGFEFVEVEIEG